MACMEHECHSCGFIEFNNSARSPNTCPLCGGDMSHTWDETPDNDDFGGLDNEC